MTDMFLIKVQVYPRNSEKNISYPDKKYPDPDRPEIKFPDPTRPENILKNVTRPWTGLVRSGLIQGNLGFRVAPQVFTSYKANGGGGYFK